MCTGCDGLGRSVRADVDLMLDRDKSLADGAILVPGYGVGTPDWQLYANSGKLDPAKPVRDYTREEMDFFLHGTGGKPVTLTFVDGKKSYDVKKPFEGVMGNLERRMLSTESAWMREELSKYQAAHPCETCGGARLKPEALSVKIAGEDISMSARRSVADALQWFSSVDEHLTSQQKEIARAILKEINERLGFLHNVGLDYLNLDRKSGTLSGGESQRIRLASQIGSGLSGVLYVLDEPSIGLHQKDNDRLLETLKRPQGPRRTPCSSSSMTEDAIRHADHVIDMGPGAGVRGGEVVCAGTLENSSPARLRSPPTISPAAARSRSPPSAARARARQSP